MGKWTFNSIPLKGTSGDADASAADIDLVENPFAAFEDKADPLIPTATNQIYQFINEDLARKPDTHVNRASSATMCVKRRWYQRNGAPGETLTPRKIINFSLGDLSEKTLLYYVKYGCVGPGKLYSEVDFGKVVGTFKSQGKQFEEYEQETLTAHIPGLAQPITAHVDGWGRRNSDGKWELIECKSAANWGFKDFKEAGPKDYLKQSHACMMTGKAKELGVRQVRYFYLRKETGHLWDSLHSFNEALAQEVIDGYVVSNQVEEPRAPHQLIKELERKKPTGRKVASFPCTYCPYLKQCHGEYVVDWKQDYQFGFKKPVYVFMKGNRK